VLEEVERRPVQTRWGWLALSLGLMALAGFFLYPSIESLRESGPIQVAKLPSKLPMATPLDTAPTRPISVRPPPKMGAHVRVNNPAKEKTTAPIPIRQVAPSTPAGIRNRIHGVIPIYVTIQIGKNGKVERAETTDYRDAVRSYLAKQALRAVKQWKFQPVTIRQKPVRTKWIVSFRFRNSQNGTNWRLLRPAS
jgi:hypothetical protein